MHRSLPLAVLLGVTFATGCGEKDATEGTAGSAEDSGGPVDDSGAPGSGDDGSGDDGSGGDSSGDDGSDDAGSGDAGDDGAGDGSSGGDGTMDDGGSGDEGADGGSGDEGSDEGSDEGGEDDAGSDTSGGSGSSGSGSSGSGSSGGSSGSGSSGGSSGSGSSGGSGSGSSGGTTGGGSTGSGATDSDGDGQLDSDELAAGTDPTDYYDRTYAGAYNVATCGTSVPSPSTPSGSWNGSATTYALGDVVANFQMTDHNGELVDLYSFCDNHVMVVFSAMWCGSCASVANQAQGKQNSYSSLGFQYLEILIEDRSGSSVDSAELNQWASSYSLSTVPVLDDSSKAELVFYEQNWGYPTIVHLEAGTMSVLSIDSGQTNPAGWL